MLDSTIFTEVPPLRAMWAPIGQQACVPITGTHAKRILTGVLNLKTGAYLQYFSRAFNQDVFANILHVVRRHWRGWHIVLFLDRSKVHRAKYSLQLLSQLDIEVRWLPKACPELNAVDHLWRHLKKDVLANEPLPNMDATLKRAWSYLADLSPRERLQKAGVLSKSFWLASVL